MCVKIGRGKWCACVFVGVYRCVCVQKQGCVDVAVEVGVHVCIYV